MVDYNSFAKTFSNSRKNMKWEEIDYFISFLSNEKKLSILDIGCGNGRFLGELLSSSIANLLQGKGNNNYLGVDLSKGLLDEARSIYKESNFLNLDMLNLDKIKEKFSSIFFIASFHHLKTIDERLKVLDMTYKLLEKKGKIFMTNWALHSDLNLERYKKNIIDKSENSFGSLDYNIKIGKYFRFYHSFDLLELEYLFKKTGFKVIENRLFNNNKNYISIVSK